MHIKFTKISYKNILSVGSVPIEIDLVNCQTTLISGKNGAGKSILLEALIFALYGKSFRKINKPQLLNSINRKELLVILDFVIGKESYQIRRGLKPAVFEIYKNEQLLNKDAASSDFQAYLEETILKMSYKSFTQIVVLGSATYVPFMELTTGQRREIIEDLLDIQIFSTMNTILKSKIDSNKVILSELSTNLTITKSKLESAKEHNAEIERLKKTELDKLKLKAKNILEIVDMSKAAIQELEGKTTERSIEIADKEKKRKFLSEAKRLYSEIEQVVKTNEKEIDFYSDNDSCPTCLQLIETSFKEETLDQKQKKIIELRDNLNKLKDRIEKIETRLDEISAVEDELRKLYSKINEHRVSIKISTDQLSVIKSELTEAKKEIELIDQSKIEQLTDQMSEFLKTQKEQLEEREVYSTVSLMLKDGGIKTSIIQTYIPIMNRLINQYLSEFELFVDFHLDENFNETIKSRFRDTFSFASFSEGEKMRISLSIMFAWRALAKLRNSISTNLLILDETLDGASDSQGVESLIEILKKLNSSDNIFVISHRGDQFSEKFDRHILFEKVRDFTELTQ